MKKIITSLIASTTLLSSAEYAKVPSMSNNFGKNPVANAYYQPRPVGFLFEFKDGSRFRGKIRDISNSGVILSTLDNRTYIHHYPTRPTKKSVHPITGWIENGDGTYSEPPPEIPMPPLENRNMDINPPDLPQCVVARIAFLQFNRRTLDNLYTYYAKKTKEDVYKGITYSYNKQYAWSIHNAKFARVPINQRNNPVISNSWRNKVFWEYTGYRNVVWGGK